ncbi:phage tail tape measure protein [Jiella pacifica]|uniref:Phage tail tape measure protein n=1 Tax=Jiella pacifica TaxID=2696469 RepID=A0A6N9SWA2_9HYPH|nr:phage tail tape measure protein [Jiella pacifica]NDW03071.1 phage tail tape measure protein [Jiella pacifica]
MDEDETFTVAIKADTSGLDKALSDLSGKADRFGSALTSAFAGAVTGGRSFESVLQQLAARLSTIALDAALKPLGNLASNAVGQLFSALGGGGAGDGGGGGVLPFAKGGVVAAPSYFPAGGRVGLMGEAGAEAILPLSRGADGTLGVAAPRGQGGSTIVFNVSTPDAPSFRRAEAQIQAMLTRAASRGRRGL